MDDLKKAFEALTAKQAPLTTYSKYIDGPQPLRYSTQRLEEAFEDIRTHFEVNWCSIVVSATNDRLGLSGFDVSEDPRAKEFLSEQFERLGLMLEAQKVHKDALGLTQAYLIIGKNEAGEIEAYRNDPRMVEVFYDPKAPKNKTMAAKRFALQVDGQDGQEITLYYPDRIEHWQAPGKGTSAANFKLITTDPNQYGIIPVFEWSCDGEVSQVVTLQDAVNKTFADLMVALEFGAFVQRWIISQSDPSDLKSSPGEVWWVPAAESGAQATSIGQFTPTAPGPFLDTMDKLTHALFIITRTPLHYLVPAGANLSGEALLAMEAPLTKKVKWYQRRFEPAWKEAAQFILKLGGMDVEVDDITVTWERTESTQPFTEAQTTQIEVTTGLPLITVLRRRGWTQAEIDQMLKDIEEERKSKKTLAQATLDKLRIEQDQEIPPNTTIAGA